MGEADTQSTVCPLPSNPGTGQGPAAAASWAAASWAAASWAAALALLATMPRRHRWTPTSRALLAAAAAAAGLPAFGGGIG